MTPRDRFWEEEFAILLGSDGAYRSEDVRRMTPERRAWTLRRLSELAGKRKDARQPTPGGPTVRGRPVRVGGGR